MDSASDEINLLLPLVFGLIVFFFLAIAGLICWLLLYFKVIEISDKYYFLGVLKDASISLLGVFAISAIIGGVVFILNIIISFFKNNL